jgi:hypothetical protein
MIPRGPENFGHVTTVPPRSSHYQNGFLIGNWNTHHGSRINHAQRQLKSREAVTPRTDSLHSCVGLPASLSAFLAKLLKTSDVRIVGRTPVATGHVLGMGELAIVAQSQKPRGSSVSVDYLASRFEVAGNKSRFHSSGLRGALECTRLIRTTDN